MEYNISCIYNYVCISANIYIYIYINMYIYIYVYIVDGDESYILRNLYRKKSNQRFPPASSWSSGSARARASSSLHEFAHLETTWNNVQDTPKHMTSWVLICFNMLKWRFQDALNRLNGVRTGFFYLFFKHFLMKFNILLSIISLANANLLIRIHEFQFYKLNELSYRPSVYTSFTLQP